ncbi:MAG TPA: hypothetical protein VJ976_01805, partial [Ornithinimicrobium sp.]|nr:hypothetical protein [Ornithinimicrobium sp.]
MSLDTRSRPSDQRLSPQVTGALNTWLADGWTVTWRNLSKIKRSPDVLVFAVLQPIMFVLLFSQVYGGII